MDARTNDSDTSLFGPDYLEAKAVEGAFDGVRALVEGRFLKNVYLVSKCGSETQRRTRRWLEYHDFFASTGVPANHVQFCLQREGKVPICRRLGVTHFVDDRLEILGYLADAGVGNLFLFDPLDSEVKQHSAHLSKVNRTDDWESLLKALLG